VRAPLDTWRLPKLLTAKRADAVLADGRLRQRPT